MGHNHAIDGLSKLANGALAWEGLRRNTAYRREWKRVSRHVPKSRALATGARYIKSNDLSADAEQWGLVTFSNPNKSAPTKPVLWHPAVLAGALRVQLQQERANFNAPEKAKEKIVLSELKSDRFIVDHVDGMRHVRLGGEHFWIQLFSEQEGEINEDLEVKVRIDSPRFMGRQLDSAAQLLSLYRAASDVPALIGRNKRSKRLYQALMAYDIWMGFERPKGDLKEISAMLVGPARIKQDWGSNDRSLKAQATRYVERGEAFVSGRYKRLLCQKVI
jgi:hypothetical protein